MLLEEETEAQRKNIPKARELQCAESGQQSRSLIHSIPKDLEECSVEQRFGDHTDLGLQLLGFCYYIKMPEKILLKRAKFASGSQF